MVLFLAVAALTARQTPPPSIAEFAPQAVEQIKDAPSEQSSDFGSGSEGDGGGLAGATSTTTTTAPPAVAEVIDQARVRRCIGDPPRQIEDPQSPPCVSYWGGTDNGGATSKGITATEIRIAVPFIETGPAQGADELTPVAQALEQFFNSRFEFYGRRLRLVKWEGKAPDAGNPEPERQQADATAVAEELGAFASLPYAEQGGAESYYHDELARRGVISVYLGRGTNVDEDHFTEHAPYQWNIQPGSSLVGANVGEWTCKQLRGKPAQYAGPGSTGQRVFGLLTMTSPSGNDPDTSRLERALDRCGISVAHTARVPLDAAHAGSQNAILAFKQAGVTSIISFGQAFALFAVAMPAASNQAYFPEWIVSSYGGQLEDSAGVFAPADQLSHAFGLNFLNKNLPPADSPINWAVKEVNPQVSGSHVEAQYLYLPLLILASGIQMAGPNLTPETFEKALMQTTFPNPNAGQAPYYQARVGFGPGDHTFFGDAAPAWWSPAEHSYQMDQRSGTYCPAQRGLRYLLGNWPGDPIPMFEGPCY